MTLFVIDASQFEVDRSDLNAVAEWAKGESIRGSPEGLARIAPVARRGLSQYLARTSRCGSFRMVVNVAGAADMRRCAGMTGRCRAPNC